MAKRVDYAGVAAEIVRLVGGPENIERTFHCMTCLRFILADREMADEEAIKSIEQVYGVVKSGNQFIIGLGEHLLPVYNAVRKQMPDESKRRFGFKGKVYALDSYGKMLVGHTPGVSKHVSV